MKLKTIIIAMLALLFDKDGKQRNDTTVQQLLEEMK